MIKRLVKMILPRSIQHYICVIYRRIEIVNSHIKWWIYGIKIEDYKNIPIIINNYNRLDYLKRLITSLQTRGYNNIHIIDNNSSYPPLLEYYEHCNIHIFRLKTNIGYKAMWETEIYDMFKRSYYVYTDSDMQIDENCPDDFMSKFIFILERFPFSQKVGFGIAIDDIPDCFTHKAEVINHEKQFWAKEVLPQVYRAPIDTTFALYRPFCKGIASNRNEVYRTGKPYVIKHLPWYIDSKNMTSEEIYYINSISQSTHWSKMNK